MTIQDQNLAIARLCMKHDKHPFRIRLRSGATEIGAATGWVFPWYDPAKHPPTFIMRNPPVFALDGTAMRQAISLITDPVIQQAYIDHLSHFAGITNADSELVALWKLITAPPQVQARAYLESHHAWVQDPASNGHKDTTAASPSPVGEGQGEGTVPPSRL